MTHVATTPHPVVRNVIEAAPDSVADLSQVQLQRGSA